MINIKKLFNKAERGLRKEKVRVTREGKTFYREQRVGKKPSPRTGTGKMQKFPESIKKEIIEQRSYGESGAKIKIIIENLIDTYSEKDRSKMKELGLIDDKNKLTVTSQSLTNWAKSQGVDSTKKRTSAVESEKSAHKDTKKELDQSNKKVARLEVAAKHNFEETKLVLESKMESDRIRQDLGKDNRDLKSKLKTCLADKK